MHKASVRLDDAGIVNLSIGRIGDRVGDASSSGSLR